MRDGRARALKSRSRENSEPGVYPTSPKRAPRDSRRTNFVLSKTETTFATPRPPPWRRNHDQRQCETLTPRRTEHGLTNDIRASERP